MLTKPTTNFAPDGMNSGFATSAARFAGAVVSRSHARSVADDYDHEWYDDGLVHSHDWASSDADPMPARACEASRDEDEDRYDDGLVHSHGWATTCNRR